MPTAIFTYTWDANVQGWTLSTGGLWDASDGSNLAGASAPGCLEIAHNIAGTIYGNGTHLIDKTWEDWGVPHGATVTNASARLRYKRHAEDGVNPPEVTMAVQVHDALGFGTTFNLLTADLVSGLDTWQTVNGAGHAVAGVFQASDRPLELTWGNASVGGDGTGWESFLDSLELTITYTGGGGCDIAISPPSVSLAGGEQETFTASGTSLPGTWSVLEDGGGEIDQSGHYTAPIISGTYHVRITSKADNTCYDTATIVVGSVCTPSAAPSLGAAPESACGVAFPQMWLFTDDAYIGRVQESLHRDLQVGTDVSTGTACPNWIYSTGFSLSPIPGLVKGVLIDADDDVCVTVSKTVAATNSNQARSFIISPFTDQEEVWRQGISDLRAYKHRLEFKGAPATSMHRAMYTRVSVDAVGG